MESFSSLQVLRRLFLLAAVPLAAADNGIAAPAEFMRSASDSTTCKSENFQVSSICYGPSVMGYLSPRFPFLSPPEASSASSE